MKTVTQHQLDLACRAAVFAYNEGGDGIRTKGFAVAAMPIVKMGHLEGLRLLFYACPNRSLVTIPIGNADQIRAWDAFFAEVPYGSGVAPSSSLSAALPPPENKGKTMVDPKDRPQPPDERESRTRMGAGLHRSEDAAGRGPSKRKLLGCALLSFLAGVIATLAVWYVTRR